MSATSEGAATPAPAKENQGKSDQSHFTDYGKVGYLAVDYINRRINQHANPRWNVQGRDLPITGIRADGTLLCESQTGDVVEARLDAEGFSKLMDMLI
jgi:hypothetical protein